MLVAGATHGSGMGEAEALVQPDGRHPTATGHAAIAAALAAPVRSLLAERP